MAHSQTDALARVDRELREIDATDCSTDRAYLVAMWRFDWEHERRLIEAECR